MSDKVSLNQPASVSTVPTETIPLPSSGKVYPVSHPLHGQFAVAIRAMTARDEDILTSRALLKQGKVISALLRSCLMDKSIDCDELLIGDRNAIMVGIRVTGYGAEYKVETSCPACDSRFKHQFDLSQLPIKRLEAD